MNAAIIAVAHYVPPTVRGNPELAAGLGITEDWIIERTGIRERRIAIPGGTSELIIPAAEECLRRAELDPDLIDCVIVATITPDHLTPATAVTVIGRLGIKNAWGFDLSAACSGFLYALVTAAKLVESGGARRVLVCGADRMTSITDLADRNTAVLLGDGAGVAIVAATPDSTIGVRDHVFRVDPAGEREVIVPAGGSALPATLETLSARKHFLYMAGPTVFRAAVTGMTAVTSELMDRSRLTPSDLHWFVPHQANLRILEAVASRLQIPPEKVAVNVDRYGNTSAATIPIALSEWWEAGRIKPGDRIVMCSFGAGYTLGAVYLVWSTPPRRR